jgi:hypothetical protein
MATLVLTKLFLNRLDTGEAVSAQTAPDRPQEWADTGDVRAFAGGRQRAVRAKGEAGVFSPTLIGVTMPTILTLRLWKGVPLLVRDYRGQSWTGVFFQVPIREAKEPTLYNVALTIRVVTTVDPDA